MLRVLHIANARMGSGGTETFLMNIYRNIDRNKIQFDFVVFSDEHGMHEKEIEEMGGRIFRVTRKQDGLFKNLKQIYNIVKQNDYIIVHRHCAAAIMFFDLLTSKLAGAKYLIAHSHSTQDEHGLIHNICRPFLKYVSDCQYACSDAAGKWMYGKHKFQVIRNGIDCDKFQFDKQKREQKRQELNINGKIAIGNIAVFKEVKNIPFLIDIFEIIHKRNPNSVLLLIGDGDLRSELENKVRTLGLADDVKFLGTRTDISELFMALDIFVLPSWYEGLPLTMVEAQASGVECFISTGVPAETILNKDLVERIPLDRGAEFWAECILNKNNTFDRNCASDILKATGYDIKDTAMQMQKFYLSVYKSIK